MRHIRFLKSQRSICYYPQDLGRDFVALDYNFSDDDFESPCKECSQLLYAYNAKEEVEDKWRDIVRNYNNGQQQEDSKSFGRGIVLGIAIGAIAWVVIYVLLYWVVFYA